MESWKEFEKSCYIYLVRKYGEYCSFEPLGESDSTNSDIRVSTRRNGKFFIETKEDSAQCGQFVLYPDEENGEFIYSPKNKSRLNQYSQEIMDYMNENFEDFVEAGTKGANINLPDDVFYGWIKNYYASKNVRFFITKSINYIVFPIEEFDKYFSVSAKYRIKKSGSSDPARSNLPEIKNILTSLGCNYDLLSENDKLYVRTSKNLGGLKLKGLKYTYLFNETRPNLYNFRKLSNTQNANVIFSISLKCEQDIKDLQEFENTIK